MATWTKPSRNSATWTNGSKNSASWLTSAESGEAWKYNEPYLTYNTVGVSYNTFRTAITWSATNKS